MREASITKHSLRNRKKKKYKQNSSKAPTQGDNVIIERRGIQIEDKNHTTKRQNIKAILFSICILSGIALIHFIVEGNFDIVSAFKSKKYEEEDYIIEEEPLNWDINNPVLNTTYNFLLKYVCEDIISYEKEAHRAGFCHHRLRPAPERRTHYIARTRSNSGFKKGETILVLPRHLLIWDLDAMRDEFIRQELFGASHKSTNNSLDSGAFLAAYLIRCKKVGESMWREQKSKVRDYSIYNNEETDRLLEYLSMLPTYEDFEDIHPTLWSEEMLISSFGKLTPSFELIKGYRSMIVSEYIAFCQVSLNFKDNVDEKEYTMMRLNVMSRSFGPGPPQKEEELPDSENGNTLADELSYYREKVGVDLTQGCRAMSPILDMWDHHANPNVEWKYQRRKRSFEIKVGDGGIPSGSDVMVSYGKYTDTHLFGKFGFVNGDGSGYTEASVAVMHRLLDIGMGQQFSLMKREILSDSRVIKMIPLSADETAQKRSLLQYLAFDDGYDDCIDEDKSHDAYALKLLKFKHLQKIANIRDRWIIKMPPRNSTSKPAINSSIPITTNPPRFDSKGVAFDGSKVISTCRLLTLNNEDFDGRAAEVLLHALRNNTADVFFVPRQTDQLEFRALSCLARLTTMALKRYNSNVPHDMHLLSTTSSDKYIFRSREWNVLHVRLGEMQTLEVLRSIATSGAKQMRNQVKKMHLTDPKFMPAMFIRPKPCPFKLTLQLLEEY